MTLASPDVLDNETLRFIRLKKPKLQYRNGKASPLPETGSVSIPGDWSYVEMKELTESFCYVQYTSIDLKITLGFPFLHIGLEFHFSIYI